MAQQFTAEDETEIYPAQQHYCPKCKRQTPHAFVVQIKEGEVAKGWECLECGDIHD